MPLGTLRAPSLHLIIPSLQRRSPSLRLLSLAHSIKHLSSVSSASLNPTTKPSHSKSPNLPPSTRTKHKYFAPNSAVPSQRLSIEHSPSNPTKVRTNQTKPPNEFPKRPRPGQTKPVQTTSGTMNADSSSAAKRELVVSAKKKRQEYRESPAGLLQRNLDQCSKHGATVRALELYDAAVASGISMTLRNYNSLLYLCSLPTSSSSISDFTSDSAGIRNEKGESGSDMTSIDAESKFNDPEVTKMAVERGFEIYKRMCEDPNVELNEATFTSMARLAAAKGDAHLAFDLVKQM